jgi:hypothetical protein
MQLFEPIFHIAPLTIARIHRGGCFTEIGHDKTRIALGVSSRQPDDFRLDNHPAATRPTSGGVEGIAIDVFGVATVFGQAIGFSQQAPGPLDQSRVARHPDDILDSLCFQDLQPVVAGEATIDADPEGSPRECSAQTAHQGP